LAPSGGRSDFRFGVESCQSGCPTSASAFRVSRPTGDRQLSANSGREAKVRSRRTDDITRLVRFYETVSGLSATWYTDDFAELVTPSCTLAIGSKRTMDMFGGAAVCPADKHSAIIEFRVADVDKEYAKLEKVIGDFVQLPTTQPWGNRSLLFRDPDGNLINFFTPVSAEAIKKFDT
jgi:predicted enzyme related to lactoylglutathione lyase